MVRGDHDNVNVLKVRHPVGCGDIHGWTVAGRATRSRGRLRRCAGGRGAPLGGERAQRRCRSGFDARDRCAEQQGHPRLRAAGLEHRSRCRISFGSKQFRRELVGVHPVWNTCRSLPGLAERGSAVSHCNLSGGERGIAHRDLGGGERGCLQPGHVETGDCVGGEQWISSHPPAVAAAAVAPPSTGTSTVVAAPSISAVVSGLFASAGNWLAGLPVNPVTALLQGALLLLQRNPFGQAPAAVSAPAATALPIAVTATNSFTTIYGTTAAGTVTVNGDTWVANTTTHLYTTTTNLAQQWQTYYSEMKAGQGSSLNDIQRLEGNAEAVFENTGLKNLSATQLSTDRQDVQRQFDALDAAMVGAGVNLNAPLTQQQYLSVEGVLQSNPTLLELAVQGHGLNNSGVTRYAGYTNDFQNNVDNQSLYVGGGLNNGDKAIASFFDDNILSHVSFPTVVHNGVLWQLNQNGNRENTVTQAVTALDTSMSKTYSSSDFVQPPQLENKTAKQVVTAGRAFSFVVAANTFVDLQGEAMTYVATLENAAALPSWLSFNTQTEQFSGTMPTGTQPLKVYVKATNSSGLHTTEAFVIQAH